MKQEMYSNLIGKKVWDYCLNCKIWISEYNAEIESEDNKLYDRIDIEYDKNLAFYQIFLLRSKKQFMSISLKK